MGIYSVQLYFAGTGGKIPLLGQVERYFPLGAGSQSIQPHILNTKHTKGNSADEPFGISLHYMSYNNHILAYMYKGHNNEPTMIFRSRDALGI